MGTGEEFYLTEGGISKTINFGENEWMGWMNE